MSTISSGGKQQKKSYLLQFKRHELSASDAFAKGCCCCRSCCYYLYTTILHTENDTLFHFRLSFPLHTYGSFFRRWGIDSTEKEIAPVFNSLFIIYYFILSIFKWVAHFASETAVWGWILRFRLMCISSGWRRRHAQTSAAVSDEHIKKYVRHNFIRILLLTSCLFGGSSQSVCRRSGKIRNAFHGNDEMSRHEMNEMKHVHNVETLTINRVRRIRLYERNLSKQFILIHITSHQNLCHWLTFNNRQIISRLYFQNWVCDWNEICDCRKADHKFLCDSNPDWSNHKN